MSIPLFRVYGMVVGMSFALANGASMTMVPNARILKDLLDNISKYKATLFPTVPARYDGINNNPHVKAGKYDLSSIKICISGSAPTLRDIKERFEMFTGGKLFEGYGLSEAPASVICNPYARINKPGLIGLPLPDVDAKIISRDNSHTAMPADEIGELAIRGLQVIKGYHTMPTETAKVLRTLEDGNRRKS